METKFLHILEYIWLDADSGFRSKTRVITDAITDVKELPVWNYDGSSTGQAETHNSEIFLHPVAFFSDPFRRGYEYQFNGINTKCSLVWCETRTSNNVPLKNSNRSRALEVFTKYEHEKSWFGLEQEYIVMDASTGLPQQFKALKPPCQGTYYCGVGANNVPDRVIAERHMECCLMEGIKICGINAEVAPGQWEYQIGPCEGISAGDELWISRYILNRIAEQHSCVISYHPKPLLTVGETYNGSGCHTNFSTKSMREDGGYNHILNAVNKLGKKHELHINNYGENNDLRLTGSNETASINKFSFGVGSRTSSIRIPNTVVAEGKGYFEDRRPASNCDPYLVTMLITETCCSNDNEEVQKEYQNLEKIHSSHFC